VSESDDIVIHSLLSSDLVLDDEAEVRVDDEVLLLMIIFLSIEDKGNGGKV